MKEKRRWKVFTYNGKEIFAYTIFGEGQMKRRPQLHCWLTRTIAILKPFMFTKK